MSSIKNKNKLVTKGECSGGLQNLIDLVNELSDGGGLHSNQYFLDQIKREMPEQEFSELKQEDRYELLTQDITLHLIDRFENFFTDIENQAKNHSHDSKTFHKTFARIYEAIRIDLEYFKNFCILVNQIRKGNKQLKSLPSLRTSIYPLITADNKISFNSFSLNVLHDIDADRLRICEICSHIFWAKRADKETCSPDCANTRRVRLYRTLSSQEKEKRKSARKENLKYKQQLKENSKAKEK